MVILIQPFSIIEKFKWSELSVLNFPHILTRTSALSWIFSFARKMAGLVKLSRFAAKISNKNSLALAIRAASHFNKDWKPGPYPTTQAEREAAAKKYGIPIEQYEPYPDDGMGYGDYPKLPNISVDRKDPNYPYDFPETKRNFGDPIHADSDIYSEDRYNNGEKVFSISSSAAKIVT